MNPRANFRTLLALALLAAAAAPSRAQQSLAVARAAVATAAVGTPEHLRAKLAEAGALIGHDLQAARECARLAHQLADQLGDAKAAVQAQVYEARAVAKLESHAAADALLDAAEADSPPDAAYRGELLLARASIDWTHDLVADALGGLRAALDAATEVGDERLRARCELMALNIVGMPAEDALPQLTRLEAVCRQHGDMRGQLEARLLRTNALQWAGDTPAAIRQAEDLLAAATDVGDRSLEAISAIVLSNFVSIHDPVRRTELARRACRAADLNGDPEIMGLAHQRAAAVAMEDCEPEEAIREIETAIRLLEGAGMRARLHGVLDTGLRIAGLLDDHELLAKYGRRREEIQNLLTTDRVETDRMRYWRETGSLRDDLRTAHTRHEQVLRDSEDRVARIILWTSLALVVVTGSLSLLSWRQRRRLKAAVAQLRAEQAETARLTVERETIAANLQQLQRFDSLGLMAGGFAHNFNNLLVGIQGNAQALQTDAESRLSPTAADLLRRIHTAGARAAKLCGEILTYARRGDADAQTALDLREVLTEVVAAPEFELPAGIRLEFAPGPNPAEVVGDRVQLAQLFLNVALNAVEAVGTSGNLRIAVGGKRLDPSRPSGHWFGAMPAEPTDYAVVTISDDGEGMTEETIGRIFDPFFSTRFPGRGVGLAAAFGIVRRHGGIVQVRSSPSNGTTFAIHLPQTPPTEGLRSQAVPADPAALPLRRVLVVDDEPSVLGVAERALLRIGTEVLLAESAEAALKRFGDPTTKIDAAVVDFTMPGMDGGELCRILRAADPSLPIVMMSGHDQAMLQAQSPDCEFLPKPFGGRELLAALRRAATTTASGR